MNFAALLGRIIAIITAILATVGVAHVFITPPPPQTPPAPTNTSVVAPPPPAASPAPSTVSQPSPPAPPAALQPTPQPPATTVSVGSVAPAAPPSPASSPTTSTQGQQEQETSTTASVAPSAAIVGTPGMPGVPGAPAASVQQATATSDTAPVSPGGLVAASGNLFWGNLPQYGPDVATTVRNAGDPTFNIVPGADFPAPAHDGVGAFRSVCGLSHFAYDDPIVYPGQAGRSHLHLFFGNTHASARSTYASLRTDGNSTCRGGTAVRSAYWVPALLDGPQGQPVVPTKIDLYYKSGYGGVPAAAITPPPDGLRMIAGNALATAPQQGRGAPRWSCNGGAWHTGGIPDCTGTLTMEVEFPQCWDGQHLDAPDHKSHMAYPTGSGCPASHPVPIPVITYHVHYPAPHGTAQWRLASDMYDTTQAPGGLSSHGDWFDGWDPAIKRAFVQHCVAAGKDCGSHRVGDGRTLGGNGGGAIHE